MRRAITFLATGAYIGHVPVAPGTFGSALAIPLLIGLDRLRLPVVPVLASLACIVALAMFVCERAGTLFAEADSGKIVLDEICGMLVAGAMIPASAASLALIFGLFRLLDVLKPFPAGYLDRRVQNGFGVVADDLVAGLYTNVLVRAVT